MLTEKYQKFTVLSVFMAKNNKFYFSRHKCSFDMLLGCGIDPYAILEKEDMKPQSALITGLIANDQNTVKIITVTNTDYDRVEALYCCLWANMSL